jgi:hypothetical protein
MTDYNHQEELLVNWPHRGADSDDRLSCGGGGAAEKALRRDTLLEHWPKRNSSLLTPILPVMMLLASLLNSL